VLNVSPTIETPLQSSWEDFTEIVTPVSPAAGKLRLYSKSGDNLFYQNSSGVETQIGSGGGTVTSVALTSAGGIFGVSGSPITTSGTLVESVAGTSGGIPYFSSTSALSSSAALTSHAVVVGGGAGATPAVVTNNSSATNEFLTQSSSGQPAWATIASGDLPLATGSVVGAVSTTTQTFSGNKTFSGNTTTGGETVYSASATSIAASSGTMVISIGPNAPTGYGWVDCADHSAPANQQGGMISFLRSSGGSATCTLNLSTAIGGSHGWSCTAASGSITINNISSNVGDCIAVIHVQSGF
jgi:hypothetical protein